ncbi:unnamed protein product, partial [Polarella glacialis]
ALEAEVLSSRALAVEEVPQMPAAALCLGGLGEQTVAKFKEAVRNRVRIQMVVVRLPEQETDILITLNDPVSIDPESSSSIAPVLHEGAEVAFARLVRSFRVVDWGLFGAS